MNRLTQAEFRDARVAAGVFLAKNTKPITIKLGDGRWHQASADEEGAKQLLRAMRYHQPIDPIDGHVLISGLLYVAQHEQNYKIEFDPPLPSGKFPQDSFIRLHRKPAGVVPK